MSSRKQIIDELAMVEVLGQMVKAYEDVYVAKIPHITQQVLASRDYALGLSRVYQQVLAARLYQQQAEQQLSQVAVLVTYSRQLSGELNEQIFRKFWQYVADKHIDLVVIGQWGKLRLQAQDSERDFQFFELPDKEITLQQIQKISLSLLDYQQIYVFYGKYRNLMSQVPVMTSFSPLKLLKQKLPAEKIDFLFEPEISEIVAYFREHIFAGLFHQTAHESQLAHLGSRISALENAISKIQDYAHQLKLKQRKLAKSRKNRKQLQRLASIVLS